MPYDPAIEGPAAGSRRNDEVDAPSWPVLARLPWAGENEHTGQAPGYDDPYATPRQTQHDSMSALRIADHPHEAPARRHLRVDARASRKAAPHSPKPVAAPREEAESFAGHIYQWHAALAPYAPVAVTFVFALFAGLMYWSTFGRGADVATDMTAAPQWMVEAPLAAPSAAPTWAAQPSFDAFESPLSQTPDIRLEIPPIGAPVEVPAPLSENSQAAEPPVAPPAAATPIEQPGAPTAEASEPAVAAASPPERTVAVQASPFTEPLSITYPTTPFASFDFGPAATESPLDGQAAPAATTR